MASTVYQPEIPDISAEPGAAAAQPVSAEKSSYGQILKSSALVGGSQVLNIGIGIFRTKAMALFLGPAGFGLFGVYGSIANLTQSIAGMGINSSGVRQIADAVGSEDAERIGRTAAVLRKISILLGIVGASVLAIFSRQISTVTFGSTQHAVPIALLSLAVFFQSVCYGQGALVQGMRRIADLAKMGVLGAIYGTLFSIVLVYFFREKGIVPSLVSVAAMSVGTSWWYSRKIHVQRPRLMLSQAMEEAGALLKLGFALMSSNFTMMGVAYAVRVIVLRNVGYDGTGLYQSAWTLGGLYVGFILTAMTADYYPHLTATANDHIACNRLVNQQARVALLLAGPGAIATLTFAPIVISVLYSAKFSLAVPVLRWICLGAALQVVTWPIGFIIMAKGKAGLLIICELAWALVHAGLAWLCVRLFGLNGAGIAFFGSYIFHACLIYPIVSRLSGFRWSPENMRTGLLVFALIGLVFCGFHFISLWWALCIGVAALAVSSAYSIRVLLSLVPFNRLPHPLQQLTVSLHLASADTNQL
jgi:PST family polysaccharide transporter